MALWWEHSPATNVAQFRILASTPYVDWVCCWFSSLLREVFLLLLQFSLLLKNQHFQIPIRSGTHGHVSASSYELLSAPWVNKCTILQFKITTFSFVSLTCSRLQDSGDNGSKKKKPRKIFNSDISLRKTDLVCGPHENLYAIVEIYRGVR